tara:strand:- start:2711 stop:2953 length:243 start_codon:yes stop_codon:yes gene_type:complete
MSNELVLSFGAMSESIKEQLTELGLIKGIEDKVEDLDRVANAITKLYLCGYIPPSQTDKSRKKLMKEVAKLVSSKGKAKC